MIEELRKKFNETFTKEKYDSFLNDLDKKHPGDIVFRIAETPVFISKDFKKKVKHSLFGIFFNESNFFLD